ncbi:MAG: PEP-CTERM sorting domain-containing protein [Microcystis sp.]
MLVSTITNFVTDKNIYLDYFCKRSIQPAQIQTTPEPGTLLGLLAVGSLGLLARKRQ